MRYQSPKRSITSIFLSNQKGLPPYPIFTLFPPSFLDLSTKYSSVRGCLHLFKICSNLTRGGGDFLVIEFFFLKKKKRGRKRKENENHFNISPITRLNGSPQKRTYSCQGCFLYSAWALRRLCSFSSRPINYHEREAHLHSNS